MTDKNEPDVIRVRLDLKEGEPHYEMFKHVMKARGSTIANEQVRVLIKEEYDRLRKAPLLIDDPLAKEVEKFILEHPEMGFKDIDDFLRSAARRQIEIAYGQK